MVKLDLPPPDTPVTQVKVPSGIRGDAFRLLPRAPMDGELLAVALARAGRARRSRACRTDIGRSGCRVGDDLVGRALRDHLAAMHAGARAHVDDIVGLRIASSSCSTTMTVLPRSRRRFSVVEQPVVVALVQADRRLVEHVEHARQARADLRGEPDALALAARQRAGGAVRASDNRGRHC
jgi:hypothetical protein